MNKHISEQFDEELQITRNLLMEMGGLVEQQIHNACASLIGQDEERARRVMELEKRVNQLELELDDQCIQIIARRQPAASDLRMMISVLRASTDLERIGDESERIAKMALAVSHLEYPRDHYADVRAMNEQVTIMVSGALDAFARTDVAAAEAIIQADKEVDNAYRDILKRLIADMQQQPAAIELSLNITWAARALERIGDHAKNIAEYVVYLVRGEDVRHTKAVKG